MRSSRTNGQLSKLKSIKKRSPHICMFKGHFEVREVRLLWKRIASCALSGQGWPRHEVCCGKVPDGNECKRVKQNMTEKELKCSVGLPLACKI